MAVEQSLYRSHREYRNKNPCSRVGRLGGPLDGWHTSNSPQTDEERSAIKRSIDRGDPFGDGSWFAEAARALGLEITTRRRGRPKIPRNGS